ncbi:MAG: hypothetical protein IT204_22900 [Fimbriimonadaceae bacterium]|nr:hypothetical protein [Fimbriimonadaceae bacterium]
MVLLGLLPGLAAAAPAPFVAGDRVCFVGDSITHGRKWHAYLYLYYLTRQPQAPLRFQNAGIAGDSAAGAVSRLEWDILPGQPNKVVVMLGMNDIGRGYYGKPDPVDPAILQQREAALNAHRNAMGTLLTTLRDRLQPQFILCTPSPYDDTVQNTTPNLFGCNAALQRCGQMAGELATQFGGSTVDFNGPLTALNLARQRTAPTWTIVGPDRVHPGDVGMMLMAWLFLKAQSAPPTISDLAIDSTARQVVRAGNASLRDLAVAADAVTFEATEAALPFPVEPSAQEALQLVSLEADLCQQKLAVSGLAAGTWRLSIDGQAVLEAPAADWAAGRNLALLATTPQYRQALEVHNLNLQRFSTEARLRSVNQIRMMLERAKVGLDDAAAQEAYFQQFLAARNGDNTAYFRGQFDNFLKTRPIYDEVLRQVDELTARCWQLNQPRPHRWELRRVG